MSSQKHKSVWTHYVHTLKAMYINGCLFVCLLDGVERHFQQYFSYIVAVNFIGGGNQSTRKKPPTCRKSLTNLIT